MATWLEIITLAIEGVAGVGLLLAVLLAPYVLDLEHNHDHADEH